MIPIEALVFVLDLGGTFVFAISGAVAAVNRRLDVFGVLVLSFVAGNFGGITRDVLIGAVPPAVLADERYLLVSVLAGLITFFSYGGKDRLRNLVLMFDAAGLSFFAVSGAEKALVFGLSPVMGALLGMLTALAVGCCATCSFRRYRMCCVRISMPLRRSAARRSSSSVICWDSLMASRRSQAGFCASASASWQSDMIGICLSRARPREGAPKQTYLMMRHRAELA